MTNNREGMVTTTVTSGTAGRSKEATSMKGRSSNRKIMLQNCFYCALLVGLVTQPQRVQAKLRFPNFFAGADSSNLEELAANVAAAEKSAAVINAAAAAAAASSGVDGDTGGSFSTNSIPKKKAYPTGPPVIVLQDLIQLCQDFLTNSVLPPIQKGWNVFQGIILYKPPIGIVTLWAVSRWIASGRLFREDMNNDGRIDASEQAFGGRKRSKSKVDRHTGRCLDLDKQDLEYQKFGGIEQVRRRLVTCALREQQQQPRDDGGRRQAETTTGEEESSTVNDNDQRFIETLTTSLDACFTPGGSHSEYVQKMLRPMAEAEVLQRERMTSSSARSNSVSAEYENVLQIAYQTAQVRTLDSMLRMTRDRLVRTSFRLARTMRYWRVRVQAQAALMSQPSIIRDILATSLEGDRQRLALVETAYQQEIVRLGRIVSLMMERPTTANGMTDENLSLAVQRTVQINEEEEKKFAAVAAAAAAAAETDMQGQDGGDVLLQNREGKKKKFWRRVPRLQKMVKKLSNVAIRFNTDGRGKFSFQRYDSASISSRAAQEVLLMDFDSTQRPWLEESEKWSHEARKLLTEVAREVALDGLATKSIAAKSGKAKTKRKASTSGMTEEDETDPSLELELQLLQTYWCAPPGQEPQGQPRADIAHYWETIYALLNDLHQFRRIGEGKSVKWKDASFINWIRQWDLFGIPSVLVRIYIAQLVHVHAFAPYWPKARHVLREAYDVSNEIITTRFISPVKDLLTELMYRPKTKMLLNGMTLEDEEQSLDYMLRDLKFGDGSADTRHDALLKAARQYENDMNNGLVFNASRLIRLILVQVQQLKVASLHAADTIDVLLQANRFNIQLLAVIPAIVIVMVLTRVLYRALFTIRVKDLRTMGTVYNEMKQSLTSLESVLLLADKDRTEEESFGGGDSSSSNKKKSAKQLLTYQELGEFVLTIYDYLVMLDYASPQPFPSWHSDRIHQSMVEFLGPQGSLVRLGMDDQVRLVDQAKRNHEELGSLYL